ncbi:WAT1-related protein [Camellia lanceoleosa]|uniref:WAT1-related protein n=1 Tax=Camellia lanceoleosa TaxID=1840588 RepID=A0ACC0HPF1_9ERIC|nr:WAT1-related protein [Camellia lanceoleosa]
METVNLGKALGIDFLGKEEEAVRRIVELEVEDASKVAQGPIVKKYPAKLRLTALHCFFSCIQSAIWAIAMERNISPWKLSWDLNLLSVAFCVSVIVTGVAYWLRVWIIEKKGPVFVATFTPLALIITVIFSSIFWKESFYWGRLIFLSPTNYLHSFMVFCIIYLFLFVLGGLYSVEFMKANETKERKSHRHN